LEGIYNAIVESRREKNKPTLIRLTTTIGYGSKQQGTHGVHGSREYRVSLMNLKFKIFP
jgi:transketolase